MSGRAIVLVGVSSVGKTSVAEQLQQQLSDPFLHVGLDHFLAMFPQRWNGQEFGPGPGMWYATPPTQMEHRAGASATATQEGGCWPGCAAPSTHS